MSFPLPPDFERAVLDRVRSGQFASPEAVLSAILRLLEEREDEYEARLEELRRDIRVGRDQLDRGERLSREEVLNRLRDARPGAFLEPADEEGSSQSFDHNLGGIAPEYREFVHDEVRSGRYASTAQVLEASLWLLRDAESPENDEALEALRHEIDLGIQSGETEGMIPGDEVVARLAARLTSPEIEKFVERKIRDGEFRSFSEAAAAGLRILMDEETDWDPEVLRQELQIGYDSDGDEAFEWLRARVGRIPAQLRAFVDEEVRLGRYESADKVIEMALAVLHDSQLIEDAAREELLREIDFAIESGEDEEMDLKSEDLRRELQVGRDAIARGEGIPASEARQLIMNWRDEEDSARTK